jgi:hypothetical protein
LIVLLSLKLFFDSLMLLEPVAVTLDVDDFAVVQQAVQDGGGDHRIAEQLLPVAEALVGCDDGRVFLVAVGDELKKQIRLFAVHRQVTDLIDHHQGRGQIGFGSGLALIEFAHQRVHGGEIDLEAMVAGLDGQGYGQMGFANARRSQKDDVFLLADKIQVEQAHHLFFVEFGVEAEVVFLDGFGHRKPGGLHGGLNTARILGGDFLLQQMVQKAQIRAFIGFGFFHDGTEQLGGFG